MPRRPEWIHQLPAALANLASSASPVFDRNAIETLFGVSPRQAVRILNRLSGRQAGRALVIGRDELIAKLAALSGDSGVEFERVRHRRVSEELAKVMTARNARRLAVPLPGSADLAGLSAGIRLGAGKLEIDFGSGEELLGLLLELAQAIAADPERFQQTAAGESPGREEPQTPAASSF